MQSEFLLEHKGIWAAFFFGGGGGGDPPLHTHLKACSFQQNCVLIKFMADCENSVQFQSFIWL